MTWAEVIVALAKALAAGVDAYQAHQAEIEQARKDVNAQAEKDLAAVEGRARG